MPAYNFGAIVNVFTATISISTAIFFLCISKGILALKSPEDFAKMNSLLEERIETLKSFEYSVSHDLTSPLRIISGYIDVLEEDYANKLDKQGNLYLARIKLSSKRLTNLIKDVVSLSNMNSGQIFQQDEMVNCNIADIAQDIIKDYNEQNVVLQIAKDQDFTVKANASLLRLLLVNLISNAIKYNQSNPKKLYLSCNSTVYLIKDNGIGIDKKKQNLLFKPFSRLSGNPNIEGSGLGLVICKKIIEAHNGKIWVESSLGDGSIFYFSFWNKDG